MKTLRLFPNSAIDDISLNASLRFVSFKPFKIAFLLKAQNLSMWFLKHRFKVLL